MKHRLTLFALLLAASVAAAQDKKPDSPLPAAPPAAKAPPAPVIPDALQKDFFKLVSQQLQAKQQLDSITSQLNQVFEKLRASCGASHALQFTQAGDPVCEEKAPAAKPEPKK